MNEQNNFTEILISNIQDRILKGIAKTDLISIDYANRINLPKDLINEVYKKIDIEKIKAKLVERLEDEMAEKIVNKMITEFANDVKQIMCNKELREDLRFYMRDKIKQINDRVCE
jgi:DNA-binding transcriptional regulator/RsmH inhibitor MraZ